MHQVNLLRAPASQSSHTHTDTLTYRYTEKVGGEDWIEDLPTAQTERKRERKRKMKVEYRKFVSLLPILCSSHTAFACIALLKHKDTRKHWFTQLFLLSPLTLSPSYSSFRCPILMPTLAERVNFPSNVGSVSLFSLSLFVLSFLPLSKSTIRSFSSFVILISLSAFCCIVFFPFFFPHFVSLPHSFSTGHCDRFLLPLIASVYGLYLVPLTLFTCTARVYWIARSMKERRRINSTSGVQQWTQVTKSKVSTWESRGQMKQVKWYLSLWFSCFSSFSSSSSSFAFSFTLLPSPCSILLTEDEWWHNSMTYISRWNWSFERRVTTTTNLHFLPLLQVMRRIWPKWKVNKVTVKWE